MSRPGIEPWPPRREASTLEKSNSNSLFIFYSKPLQAALNVPELATFYSVKECHLSYPGIEEDLEDSDEAPVIRHSWNRETYLPPYPYPIEQLHNVTRIHEWNRNSKLSFTDEKETVEEVIRDEREQKTIQVSVLYYHDLGGFVCNGSV